MTFMIDFLNFITMLINNVLRRLQIRQSLFPLQGCEGRAGMAAVRLKDNTSIDSKKLQQISAHCAEQLPAYARPKFLRLQREVNLTSTFKHQKVRLVNDGFDPSITDEPLYYFDKVSNQYRVLTRAVYADIFVGKITV